MTLLIDDREDQRLLQHLSSYDIPVCRLRLDYGDCCFEGSGPRGSAPVLVGFERKRLTDLIASMQNRRLAGHQLRGMWRTYDYCYLVVEGHWRPSDGGAIEVPANGKWVPLYHQRQGVSYRQVDGFIASLELRGGVIVCRTGGVAETAALYVSRYQHWQKEWRQHHSHDEIYCPDPTTLQRGKGRVESREPGLVAQWASRLPGIDRKSFEVEQHFKSGQQMANATREEWMQIPGVGQKIADDAYRAIRGLKNGKGSA